MKYHSLINLGTGLGLVLLLLTGCATKMSAMIVTENANRTDNDQPSPVKIRIYELRSAEIFKEASFSELDKNEHKTLGDTLVTNSKEYPMRATDQRKIKLNLLEDTRYIGVLARFQRHKKAKWLEIIPVKKKRNNKFTIKITHEILSIAKQ